MEEKFIYVIASSLVGPVKLGISGHPEKRLRQLQTGHAARLVLHHAEAVAADRARLLERLLHRDIRYLCRHGEWFTLTVAEAIGHVRFTIIEYGDIHDLRHCFLRR